MEEEKAHELYVKLKGFTDAARFKRGLGFGATAEPDEVRGDEESEGHTCLKAALSNWHSSQMSVRSCVNASLQVDKGRDKPVSRRELP